AAVIAGALALSMPSARFSRRERLTTAFAAAGFAVHGLDLLLTHPLRGWPSLGGYVPYFIGAFAAVAVVFGAGVRRLAKARPAILAASLLILSASLWKLERWYLPAYRAAEETRPAIETLETQSAGVVLADDRLTSLLVMYTDHRPYWTVGAHGETLSDEE